MHGICYLCRETKCIIFRFGRILTDDVIKNLRKQKEPFKSGLKNVEGLKAIECLGFSVTFSKLTYFMSLFSFYTP